MSELVAARKKTRNVAYKNHHEVVSDDETEILTGLLKKQKTLNPKYFYDTLGSELFEKITRLPEYYPTRTERSILTRHAKDMANYCGKDCILIEPGSGSSEKVRLLLDTIRPQTYVPMDIAGEFLERSAVKLGLEYPWLDIHAVCADFSQLDHLPAEVPAGKRVIFYPGSTLGNMTPQEAGQFLRKLHQWLCANNDTDQHGGVLIGIDLHKQTKVLHAAYNDEQRVTAQFNLNALDNINNLVEANFDTDHFSHDAFYNEDEQRIEMHLVSQRDHIVRVGSEKIAFSEGETIHTENSYKYTQERFANLVRQADFEICASWYDDDKLFSVHYLETT